MMNAMITFMATSLIVFLVNVIRMDLLALIVVKMEHVCAKMVTMEQNAMSALLDISRQNQENVTHVSNQLFLVKKSSSHSFLFSCTKDSCHYWYSLRQWTKHGNRRHG